MTEIGGATYTSVDELIVKAPLVVSPEVPLARAATLMLEADVPYAAVALPEGGLGLVTDRILSSAILVSGLSPAVAVSEVMDRNPARVRLGDSAAEALILLVERDAELVLVTDAADRVKGVVLPRDFMVSTSAADVSLNEQLRRADTLEDLVARARRVPDLLESLAGGGLASGRVITVHSAVIDTIVRRAIQLHFAEHQELSIDAFTWLSLGSNGRREAVLSSDIDAAVAFDDSVGASEIKRYRAVFAAIGATLTSAGLSSDEHGVSAAQPLFSRTNAEWRAAAREWLGDPTKNNAAMMTSLLVDARPIHGDPGLPTVTRVFTALRRHPGTMRLLLEESLSKRARWRSIKQLLSGKGDTFDVKQHALLPMVNLARWAGLSVGSASLQTTARLREAAGSQMLPQAQADTLIEVFEVLQRFRLRYQFGQLRADEQPTDLVSLEQISAIDRSTISQAVREIAAVQRRADNISQYVDAEAWTAREVR